MSRCEKLFHRDDDQLGTPQTMFAYVDRYADDRMDVWRSCRRLAKEELVGLCVDGQIWGTGFDRHVRRFHPAPPSACRSAPVRPRRTSDEHQLVVLAAGNLRKGSSEGSSRFRGDELRSPLQDLTKQDVEIEVAPESRPDLWRSRKRSSSGLSSE